MRQGTVTTDSIFGKAPEAGRPPSPGTRALAANRNASGDLNPGGNRNASGASGIDDRFASGFATSTDNLATPPPAPTFGSFFREQLEQLSGRPWDDLVRDGQDVIAATLRPQSVVQGNARVETDNAELVERVRPQSTSQSNYHRPNLDSLEDRLTENVVDFGFLKTANFNSQTAQASGSQAEEQPLPPWFGPQYQRIGKHENLPDARVYYQNRMPTTASRNHTHNYFDDFNRLVETSVVTVRVPPEHG